MYKCISGYIPNYYSSSQHSAGLQFWFCKECNTSLCLECCIHYGSFDPSAVNSIYGQVYVRFGEIGAKSLHFQKKIEGKVKSGSYIYQIKSEADIDNEDELNSDITLKDGTRLPQKQYYDEEKYDSETKTFTGTIIYGENTLQDPEAYKVQHTCYFDDKLCSFHI